MLAECAEVEMVVAVLLTLHEELGVVPWQEHDRMLRLNILLVGLAIEFACLLASNSIIAYKTAVVLVAVEFEHIDSLVVGTPCDVREITVGRVASLKIHSIAGLCIEHAYSHLVRSLTCHRILVGSGYGTASLCLWMLEIINLGNIYLRIVGHHRLIHTIESEFCTAVAEVGTFMNAELVAMNALSVNNLMRTVLRELPLLYAKAQEEVVVTQDSHSTTLIVHFKNIVALAYLVAAYKAVLLEVDNINLAAIAQYHLRTVGIGELGIIERAYLYVLGV